jgi:hypothetical protein
MKANLEFETTAPIAKVANPERRQFDDATYGLADKYRLG